MALRTPPSWLQNGSHPAENDRLTTTGILWKSQGVADYGSMVVAQSATPGMSVQVAAGHALIAGTQTATQGFYIAYNDGATTIAIATANPTNPRIDRIVVAVQDAFYGGTANNQVLFQAVTGTPASSPVAPAAPSNSITLAYVAVAAGATSITNFGNVNLTSTWQKYSLTATLPSLVGKTLGTDGNNCFRLDFGFTFSPERNEVVNFVVVGIQGRTRRLGEVW